MTSHGVPTLKGCDCIVGCSSCIQISFRHFFCGDGKPIKKTCFRIKQPRRRIVFVSASQGLYLMNSHFISCTIMFNLISNQTCNTAILQNYWLINLMKFCLGTYLLFLFPPSNNCEANHVQPTRIPHQKKPRKWRCQLYHGRGESEPYPGATQRFATDTVEVWFHGHHSTIGWRFKGDTDTFTSEPLEGYYFIDVFPSEYIFVNQFTALEIQ